jgi:hypothetical protein
VKAAGAVAAGAEELLVVESVASDALGPSFLGGVLLVEAVAAREVDDAGADEMLAARDVDAADALEADETLAAREVDDAADALEAEAGREVDALAAVEAADDADGAALGGFTLIPSFFGSTA